MPVRAFDGNDDQVLTAVGSAGIAFGAACTLMVLAKKSVDNTWDGWLTGFRNEATSTQCHSIASSNGNKLSISQASGGYTSTIDFLVADGWRWVGYSRNAGTVGTTTAVVHKGPVASSTGWLHETSAGFSPWDTVDGGWAIGSWHNGDFAAGKVAVATVLNAFLDQTTVEDLFGSGASQDIFDHANCVALWEPGQATPVEDAKGTADQVSIVGTTIDNADDPVGWNFLGAGGNVDPLELVIPGW